VVSTTKIKLTHGEVRACAEGPSDGPTILWVHGASYPLEVFSGLTKELINDGFQCIRYDLYGRGFSDWDGSDLSATALADQALEVLQHFKIESKVHLISLSNADLLVNAIGCKIPKQIESITWIAPSGFDRRTMNPFARLLAKIPGFETVGTAFMRPYLIRRMKAHQAHLDPKIAPDSTAVYELSIRSLSENPKAVAAATNQLKNLPKRPDIEFAAIAVAGARIPVLSISFGEEKDTHDEDLDVFRNPIRPTEIQIEQGSHMAVLEDPYAVLEHLRQFLGI